MIKFPSCIRGSIDTTLSISRNVAHILNVLSNNIHKHEVYKNVMYTMMISQVLCYSITQQMLHAILIYGGKCLVHCNKSFVEWVSMKLLGVIMGNAYFNSKRPFLQLVSMKKVGLNMSNALSNNLVKCPTKSRLCVFDVSHYFIIMETNY